MNIGIVNDMDMATQAIRATLDSNHEHRVLWTANSGPEAVRLCRQSPPDLVLMDLVMPGMNGAQATREIMRSSPTAILVVTASVNHNCGLAFEAMGAGALDVITTPSLASNAGRHEFLQKLAQMAAIITDHQQSAAPPACQPNSLACGAPGATDTLVAIGCSAGGPAALAEILTALAPVNQAAVVIIQHIDARFIDDLARWLKDFSKDPLQLVTEGDQLQAGRIFLAGKDGHLEAHACARLRYNPNLGGLAYQPSVDVFFASIARHWKGRALGIILTGMGRDGAAGLQAMRDAGFLTIAQNEASSALFGMPKAAAPFAAEILPLASIAARINQWIQSSQ
ncbi:MAG: chemotaxis-specific protein-glutamate methyltransferase CheB [Verrucomicrobia bacterium]|nr:chemotaxis-specific protein-glutamate methyltransferase CheB [Verrucomicrobiota bacterium]